MKRTTIPSSRSLSGAAERQMRTWAIGLQTQQQMAEQNVPHSQVRPYLAISREAGVDGSAVAELVASQLHWKVLDRDLLDCMAEQNHWSRVALDFVDERTASWFNETLGKWLDRQAVSQLEYVHNLARIVVLAAQHESTIFVGRGAQFLLPRAEGASVRLIAPRDIRAAELTTQEECSKAAARKRIDEIDEGRAAFVKRYFQRDVADPHLYDLTISLEHISPAYAADIIVRYCQSRFASAVCSSR